MKKKPINSYSYDLLYTTNKIDARGNLICPTKSTTCPICFQEVEIGYKFIVRGNVGWRYFCGHGCCLSCSVPWFDYLISQYKKLYCPSCRLRVSSVRKYHNLCLEDDVAEDDELHLEQLESDSKDLVSCSKEDVTFGERLYLDWLKYKLD